MNAHVKQSSVAMGLDERALLVRLSISSWSAKKTDKEVSKEVVESHNAKKDSGYFRKSLLSKEALKTVNKVNGAARQSHYTLTLPWSDDGSRIITTEAYQHYSKVMRDYRKTFQDAVDEFLEGYDAYVEKAREELGTIFKETDYPAKAEVKAQFAFDVEPRTISTTRDFRAKVSDKETAAIIKDIERRTNERLNSAMKDVWTRIADVSEKMSTKLTEFKPRHGLKDSEGVFRDSLVENVRDLADLLPKLNINQDPKLDKIHKELIEGLCHFDAEDLREDAKARAITAKKARQIFDKVSTYLA